MVAKRLLVHGRVQGVGFRFATCIEAKRLGVNGWVRNRHDGTVEIHVEGTEELVDELTDWASHGPPNAHVTRLDIKAADPENTSGFTERA
ncbi:acylphosphatase [Silvimonas iriomotensis]|uniref:Acylphosphatase n=1 Tax=Silvimonas iriomotensis TaxID=449662 RepID=A0ABQ2PF08_9NEIS|nr:acylphosphatase [Silvimonas iriomotensis]GGP24154.1 acylphosphatase [Silvimonas iriomotensis]